MAAAEVCEITAESVARDIYIIHTQPPKVTAQSMSDICKRKLDLSGFIRNSYV